MRHIPNILSASRIGLIPFFVFQVYEDNWMTAAIILLISGLTDFLDGFLARTFNWTSSVGKVLDPVSDKLTQVTVCVMLAFKMPAYWIFFAVLLFKEFIMLLLGGWLLQKKVHIKSSRWFGKVVTGLFYLTMIILLFFSVPAWAVYSMLALLSVVAICGGSLYIPQFLQYCKEAQKNSSTTQVISAYRKYQEEKASDVISAYKKNQEEKATALISAYMKNQEEKASALISVYKTASKTP